MKKNEPWPYEKTRPPGWEAPAKEPLAKRLSKAGTAFIETGKSLIVIAILLPVVVILVPILFAMTKAFLFH